MLDSTSLFFTLILIIIVITVTSTHQAIRLVALTRSREEAAFRGIFLQTTKMLSALFHFRGVFFSNFAFTSLSNHLVKFLTFFFWFSSLFSLVFLCSLLCCNLSLLLLVSRVSFFRFCCCVCVDRKKKNGKKKNRD